MAKAKRFFRGLLSGVGVGLAERQEKESEFRRSLNKMLFEMEIKKAEEDPLERRYLEARTGALESLTKQRGEEEPRTVKSIKESGRLKGVEGRLEEITSEEEFALGAEIQEYQPIKKSPLFKEGKGPEAWRSPHIAKMTPKAKTMIDSIKTVADFNEFIYSVDKFVKSGNWTENDKNTVLEYFGKR